MNATKPQAQHAPLCLLLSDEDATQALAETIAQAAKPGDCILLRGDLGAGKTAFAKGFIRSLLKDADVTSPTFNLVQTYETPSATVWHFDLYRLKSPAELPEIGLEEALEKGITLVEWPDIAENYWPENALTIELAIGEAAERRAILTGANRWQPVLMSLTITG